MNAPEFFEVCLVPSRGRGAANAAICTTAVECDKEYDLAAFFRPIVPTSVEKQIQHRSKAVSLYLQGLSKRAITNQLDCSRSLVRNAIAKFRAGLSLKDAARSGIPGILMVPQWYGGWENPKITDAPQIDETYKIWLFGLLHLPFITNCPS